MAGHGKQYAARSDPVEGQSSGGGEDPAIQVLMDLIAPLVVRMEAMESQMAKLIGAPPPPPTPFVIPGATVPIVPVAAVPVSMVVAGLVLEPDVVRSRVAAAVKATTAARKGKRLFEATHEAAGARQVSPRADDSVQRREPRVCFRCGRPGHLARSCRLGRSSRGGGRGPAQGRGHQQQFVQQQYQQPQIQQFQLRVPQPVRQQSLRLEAPPAGQVRAVIEESPDQFESVSTDSSVA